MFFSMFSAIKNSFWLNNSIIYQTPSKSFFLSAIPFKNQKHLQYNQLQFSFFPCQVLHFYTFFSLFQICHIFTCYIIPFCFILQLHHILSAFFSISKYQWILNLFSYNDLMVIFCIILWQICEEKSMHGSFKKFTAQLYKNTLAFIATILPITFFFFTFSTVTAIFLNVAWNCNKNKLKQSTTLLASIQRD